MDKKSRQQVGMISTLVERFDTWKCISCMFALLFAACLLIGISNAYAADPYEGTGNNTRATATAITFTNDTAKFYGAEIDTTTDLDWYSFTAVAKDSINITLTNNTSNFNPALVIYNASNQKILEADNGLDGQNESLSGVVLEAAGTYYIGVGLPSALSKPAGFQMGLYNLDVSKKTGATGDANEVNDTMGAATALTFTANQAVKMGKVGTLIDQDWFSFTGSKATTTRDSVTITLTGAALKGMVVLYDSAGAAISTKTAATTGEALTIGPYLATYSGSYYIKVSGVSSTGSYTLTANKQSVAIWNFAPTASFTVEPSAGYTTTNFAFDASASSDVEDLLAALRFSWDFDGDGAYEITDSTAATAAYMYADSGLFWAKVRVKDSGDSTAVDSIQIQVRDAASNTAPDAAVRVTPTSGTVATVFTFNADSSSDADDALASLKFSWDFDGDGDYEITDTSTTTATYTFADTGLYTVKLRVKDTGNLTDSATVEILISPAAANAAPTAAFSVAPSIGAVNETEFTVDASASSDPEDAAGSLMVRWDWENDGTYDTDYSTEKAATHMFADTGVFTIKLQVKDSGDLTDSTTHTVRVVDVQADSEYVIMVNPDSSVSFGSVSDFQSYFTIQFGTGDVAGKNITFIGYGSELPAALGLPQASHYNGAYYSISSTEITAFTGTITFEYTDSLLTIMFADSAAELEQYLTISVYNATEGKFEVQSVILDAANNRITVENVDHFSIWAISDERTTDVAENPGSGSGTPTSYELAQNYPNPFNPTTKIDFNMPKSGFVSVTIYNILGQKVRSLVNEARPAGFHSIIWDGANDFGAKMSSGVYIYRMQTGEFMSTRKMMLIK